MISRVKHILLVDRSFSVRVRTEIGAILYLVCAGVAQSLPGHCTGAGAGQVAGR